MMRKFLTAALALLAAACTAPQNAGQAAFVGVDGKPLVMADGVIDNAVQEALNASLDACTKAGGAMQPVCRMQKPICLITFSGAGKECTDGSQCGSGRCMAPEIATEPTPPAKGVCATTNDPCGCHQRIENGVAQPALCVD